jgi:hypothetical protein
MEIFSGAEENIRHMQATAFLLHEIVENEVRALEVYCGGKVYAA